MTLRSFHTLSILWFCENILKSSVKRHSCISKFVWTQIVKRISFIFLNISVKSLQFVWLFFYTLQELQSNVSVPIAITMLGSNKSVERRWPWPCRTFLSGLFSLCLQSSSWILWPHTWVSRMAHMNPLHALQCKFRGLKMLPKASLFWSEKANYRF